MVQRFLSIITQQYKMWKFNMKKILFGLFVLVGGIVFTGCLKSKDPGCPYTDVTKKAPDSQVVKIQNYLETKGITDAVKDSASGIYYHIVDSGTTTSPGVCSVVTVHYKGSLTNDNVFDKTNGTPVSFRLGDLIVGWHKGLKFIKGGGGKIKLYIPPYLGYGSVDAKDANGNVVIPANSILIFEVELVAVQ